ncbi:MAG: hypothetical protein AB1497_10885 [Bacillota bacterium]
MRGTVAGTVGTLVQASLNRTWRFAGLTKEILTDMFARALLLLPREIKPSMASLLLGLFAQVGYGYLAVRVSERS